jgi:inner membrane protein
MLGRVDNLTHSLIGLVAGDATSRFLRPSVSGLSAESRRTFLVTMGVVSGNLPDLDLIHTWRPFEPDKLTYLLDHRGHTHTVIGCLILGLLLYACVEGWARFRRLSLARSDRIVLGLFALFGTLLHLGFDFLNSYGVHPFWPIDNRWIYGDAVFIIEPLYWLAAVPMFFVLRTVAARIVIGLALVLALAVNVFVHLEQPAWWVAGVAVGAALLFLSKRVPPRVAALTSAGLVASITLMYVSAANAAARRVESLAAATFPAYQTLDHALSPSPMNPLCWDVLLVQTGESQYVVRRGVISTAPALMPSLECRMIADLQEGTAPTTPMQVPATDEMRWLTQFSIAEARLTSLIASDCDASALMIFVRVPYAAEIGGRWVIGDMRFDREEGLGMSEIELPHPAGTPCRYQAPWTPPRADVLKLRAAR